MTKSIFELNEERLAAEHAKRQRAKELAPIRERRRKRLVKCAMWIGAISLLGVFGYNVWKVFNP